MSEAAPVVPLASLAEPFMADPTSDEAWLANRRVATALDDLRTAQEAEQRVRQQFEGLRHDGLYNELRAAILNTAGLERTLAEQRAAADEAKHKYPDPPQSYVRRTGEREAELVLRGNLRMGAETRPMLCYRLLDTLFRLDQQCCGLEHLTLRINSNGGLLIEGLNLIDGLLSLPVRITTIVEGTASSAAALVALIGSPIKIRAGARIMLHSCRVRCPDAMTQAELADTYSVTRSNNARVRDILKAGTRLTDEQIEEVMIRDVSFTAEEAIAAGLAHEIIEPGIDAAA